MQPIHSYLQALKVAPKQVFENLTVFPLLGQDAATPDYILLDQAIEQGMVAVVEVNAAGSVPELKLVNSGKQDVLLIEGEELVGAKQNRIVNATFLIGAGTEVVLPVSCVEQGRWMRTSERFTTARRMLHPSLRADTQQDVRESLGAGRGYRSDQGRVWDGIAHKLDRMAVMSKTAAMADAYETHRASLADYIEHFTVIDCQLAAVFAINGEILGFEGFGCHDTFRRFAPKLVQSYALDAVDWRTEDPTASVPPHKTRQFVESMLKSTVEEHPSLGKGTQVRLESRAVTGAGLVEKERPLHLSAFRKKGKSGSVGGPHFGRFSDRRNHVVF